jgi:hypothetical protein
VRIKFKTQKSTTERFGNNRKQRKGLFCFVSSKNNLICIECVFATKKGSLLFEESQEMKNSDIVFVEEVCSFQRTRVLRFKVGG